MKPLKTFAREFFESAAEKTQYEPVILKPENYESTLNTPTTPVDTPTDTPTVNGNAYPASETSSAIKGYYLGDSLVADGKDVTVVELLGGSTYHVKNKDAPFDSFIIDLLTKEVIE